MTLLVYKYNAILGPNAVPALIRPFSMLPRESRFTGRHLSQSSCATDKPMAYCGAKQRTPTAEIADH